MSQLHEIEWSSLDWHERGSYRLVGEGDEMRLELFAPPGQGRMVKDDEPWYVVTFVSEAAMRRMLV